MQYESPRRKLGNRPQKIELDGRSFEFVTGQRHNTSAIYKSEDTYVRIGDPQRVLADLALHRQMESAGFPVAKLLAHGERDGEAYFIESSLGEKHLGHTFAEDVEREGVISQDSFNNFLGIVQQFAKAQLATRREADFDEFRRGILLEQLCAEMPEYAGKLRERFEQVKNRTESLPFVLTHGDFNPNNIYPTGVIDLEDSFYAPFGYDLVGALSHIDAFPDSKEYEYFAKYRFTPEQKQLYFEALNPISLEEGLPPLSQFQNDFDFCRAVWLGVDLAQVPKLQRFRFDLIAKNYLS